MMDRDEAYRLSLQQIRSGDVSAACRTVADYGVSNKMEAISENILPK